MWRLLKNWTRCPFPGRLPKHELGTRRDPILDLNLSHSLNLCSLMGLIRKRLRERERLRLRRQGCAGRTTRFNRRGPAWAGPTVLLLQSTTCITKATYGPCHHNANTPDGAASVFAQESLPR